jgi:transcriptional regulator GlxA family with amidase domain
VLVADRSLADLPEPDVVFVPGGFGARRLMLDQDILDWLRRATARADCIAGVSTGSLLLAAAGVLDGVEATTHWLVAEDLAALGAVPRPEPVVERDRIITAGGGASALEVTYRIVGRVFGSAEAHQLRLQIADEGQDDIGASPTPRRRRHVAPANAGPGGSALSPYVLD